MARIPLLPILSLAGVVAAAVVVATGKPPLLPAAPLHAPGQSPYPRTVAGAGLVEPRSRAIAVGTPIAGVVRTVHVAVGDRVQVGQPLLQIDDRSLQAELAVRQAQQRAAAARLAQLAALPRPEDVPAAAARAEAAKVRHDEALALLANLAGVAEPGAVRREDLQQRQFAVAAAAAGRAAADAELARLQAGAWERELEAARADVAAAQAAAAQAAVEIERHIVRAPQAATVLQVDVRAGEHVVAGAGAGGAPLLLLGDVDVLHVRVDVDENDAWRVRPGAAAVAHLRGDPTRRAELRFVHIEPFVVPKRSLTGSSFERVDTRVLQVVYAFDPKAMPAYVGQQVDVFLAAEGER